MRQSAEPGRRAESPRPPAPRPSDDADDDRLDRLFHALADRTRRQLLARMAQGPAMITDLAAPFAMSLPAVSKHIKVLEAAGLITRSIDGRVHRCALAPESLRDIDTWLTCYRGFWDQTLSALAHYLEDPADP